MSKEIPFWQQLRDLKLKGPKPEGIKRAEKKAKGAYFSEQIAKAAQHCENCGKSLAGTKAINPAAMIAHILPKSDKSGCPAVAFHPMNTWHSCINCHNDYDTKGADFVTKMQIFVTLVERVAKFYDQMPANERRRVPVYFRPKK